MTRHDPASHAGWVQWPAEGAYKGFRDNGEGGMSAYACWSPHEGNKASVCMDGISILMQEAEVFVGASGPGEVDYTHKGWREEIHGVPAGYYADAVIMLGSTGGTWVNEDTGQWFKATWYDLTDEAKRILMALSNLYGSEPDILTFLDI